MTMRLPYLASSFAKATTHGHSTAAPPVDRECLLDLLAHQQRIGQAGLMTAGLAHDVNNHVQAISGIAYLALTADREDDMRAALKKIQLCCQDLAETTSALMGFVRRRSDASQGCFQASDVLSDTYRLGKTLAKQHGVVLTTNVVTDALLEGEKRLAIQALLNLVANAIRACAAKAGHVSLVASCPLPQSCRLEVIDDGPGIPESVRSNLFRPFATGHEDDGGHGIGLYLVRECILKLGGTINVRTSEDGTTFPVDLPSP